MYKKLLIAGAISFLFGMLAIPAGAQAGSDSDQLCLGCHNSAPVNLILHTAHAQKGDDRTPFANEGCQSCHGDGTTHMTNPMAEKPPVRFGANSPTPVIEQNAMCLNCHEGDHRINWIGSQHESNDNACATCHTKHALKDPVVERDTQAEVCFACHTEQRANQNKRSRHPTKEGKVICSDCHAPHGSDGPTLLAQSTVNDTCYQCHTEKRGPFLWEHAPVTDNCANCHDPHGSNLPPLMNARTPMLCQECHEEAYHPSDLYTGSSLPGGEANSRLIGRDCMNCHSKVHGSNHPSGARFTR